MSNPSHTDVDAVSASSFALADELAPCHGDWHSHRVHQLLYAARGVMRLEVEGARWTLPSARAAWLTAGVRHRVDVSRSVALRTVYFRPEVVPEAAGALGVCNVFSVSPLCREMILYGMRWGADRSPDDARANRFFSVLADCCTDWLAATKPFSLPRARTRPLASAMDAARQDLVGATSQSVARAAGLSTRSLSRRFRSETGMTWRRWLRTARILRSMELLADPSNNITQTALSVGFDSPAAFTHAFRALVDDSPSAFARRVRRMADGDPAP